MTIEDQRILKEALYKAIKNGYKPNEYIESLISHEAVDVHYKMLIFDHDFAKAFWYKEKTKPQPAMNFSTSIVKAQPARLVGWQNHLQIMVVEENPIKYIERYL